MKALLRNQQGFFCGCHCRGGPVCPPVWDFENVGRKALRNGETTTEQKSVIRNVGPCALRLRCTLQS